MPNSALQKLQAFHERLYSSAIETSSHNNIDHSLEIQNYSKNFQLSLPRSYQQSDLTTICQSISKADYLLFGDFHTLNQSQKGFLRIIRHFQENYTERPLCIALEIFNGHDQQHLNDFLEGKTQEAEFLERIDYHKKWGFPWDNYRPIVAFCKTHKIPIQGINAHFDSKNSLDLRDSYAASVLIKARETYENCIIFCLIGEYHLADQHLLSYLPNSNKVVRIVNNIDEYSIKHLIYPIASTDYLQLKERFFCLINTAPWIKWQSLTLWEEIHSNVDPLHSDDFEPYTEHYFDFDYHFLQILKCLNDFLSLGLGNSELTKFDIYVKPDQAMYEHIKSKIKLTKSEIHELKKQLELNGYAYIHQSSTILLRQPSIDKFAEISGYYLYDHLKNKTPCPASNLGNSLRDRIQRKICGTVTSLLMNPRRPTFSITQLDSCTSKTRSVIQRVLDQINIYQQDFADPENKLDREDRRSDYQLTRIVGEILGRKIFITAISSTAPIMEQELKNLFTTESSAPTELGTRVVTSEVA